MSITLGNTPANDFVLEITLKEIDKCLYIAGDYGGKVYRGFVRDVIVPRMKDPLCKVNFKDVNLWFTSFWDANCFISDMTRSYTGTSSFTKHKYDYGSNIKIRTVYRTQYQLYMYGTYIALFDIVVSETFLQSDFDVNCLSYSCNRTKGQKFQSEDSWCDKDKLIDAINKKEMSISSVYFDKLFYDNETLHINRINDRYIAQGWTIIFDATIKFSKPIESNDLIKLRKIYIANNPGNKISTNPSKLIEDFIRDDALAKEAATNKYKSYYKCAQHFGILDENFMTLIMKANSKLEEDLMINMIQKIILQQKK